LVKKAQGMADRKLTNQIIAITFLALPVEDLERGDMGRQMARYLQMGMTEIVSAMG
jgi:hypothetical protein